MTSPSATWRPEVSPRKGKTIRLRWFLDDQLVHETVVDGKDLAALRALIRDDDDLQRYRLDVTHAESEGKP